VGLKVKTKITACYITNHGNTEKRRSMSRLAIGKENHTILCLCLFLSETERETEREREREGVEEELVRSDHKM
jgi:hypothetical protein